jgi:hypothetical protein
MWPSLHLDGPYLMIQNKHHVKRVIRRIAFDLFHRRACCHSHWSNFLAGATATAYCCVYNSAFAPAKSEYVCNDLIAVLELSVRTLTEHIFKSEHAFLPK